MATKKKQTDIIWPKVTTGSHLTVFTYENGETELKWDDEALLRDVRAAILKFESTMPVATEQPKKAKKQNVKTNKTKQSK